MNVVTSNFQLQRINKLQCQFNIILFGAKALNLIKAPCYLDTSLDGRQTYRQDFFDNEED